MVFYLGKNLLKRELSTLSEQQANTQNVYLFVVKTAKAKLRQSIMEIEPKGNLQLKTYYRVTRVYSGHMANPTIKLIVRCLKDTLLIEIISRNLHIITKNKYDCQTFQLDERHPLLLTTLPYTDLFMHFILFHVQGFPS